ncbi:uncharacterized protein LOC131649542 [Vicia villosa]|uniref:uncharacterized protein LOC131649542 n=1 Tax=Vicia villosa TaxID=3911 RepID=UPI00273C2558|nr:uncharacterized protein LOC131649542 [Vicia villosa]
MGGWNEGVWSWGEFGIPQGWTDTAMEANLLHLQQLLSAAPLWCNRNDAVVWAAEKDGNFTVSSCYHLFNNEHIPYFPAEKFDVAFQEVWRMEAPLKVKAFGWTCFINKLPTRDELSLRGIINHSFSPCVFCCVNEKSSFHSLMYCYNSDLVWKDIAKWVGFKDYKAEGFKESFLMWSSFCNNQREWCGWRWFGRFGK